MIVLDKPMGVETDQRALGAAVRTARQARGLTQQAVADHLGIQRSAVSDIETGQRGVRATELRQLAHVLGTSADALVGLDSEDITGLVAGLDPGQLAVLAEFAEFLVWRRGRANCTGQLSS